jgi:hypothetical protein
MPVAGTRSVLGKTCAMLIADYLDDIVCGASRYG